MTYRVAFRLMAAVATASLAALLNAQAVATPQPSTAAPAQRVKSISELQPAIPDEKARAAYYAKERTSEMTIQELVDLGGGGLRLQYRQSDARVPFLPVVCLGSRPDGEACAVASSPEAMVRLEANLRKPVCSAEVVVAVRVTSQKAMLTTDGKALFTDYAMEVQQWLRPASGAPGLIVSEWGGALEIAGKLFALTRAGLALAPGKNYILVLGTLEGAAGYALKNEPIELTAKSAVPNYDPLAQVAKAAASCGAPR